MHHNYESIRNDSNMYNDCELIATTPLEALIYVIAHEE